MLLGGLKRRPTPAQAFFSVACKGYGQCMLRIKDETLNLQTYPGTAVLDSCPQLLPTTSHSSSKQMQAVFTKGRRGKGKGGRERGGGVWVGAQGVWDPPWV